MPHSQYQTSPHVISTYRHDLPLVTSYGGGLAASVRASPPANDATTAVGTSEQAGGTGTKEPGGNQPCTCGAHREDRLLNTQEAADKLGVSKEYLEKLRTYGMRNGTPPKFARIGRRVLYRNSELEAFIDRRSARTTSEYVAYD